MEPELTWEALVQLEPKLAELADRVRRAADNVSTFCEDKAWFGETADVGFRAELILLIGWNREGDGEPVLRSSEAYELAYLHLYDLLPRCFNCPAHPADVDTLRAMPYALYLRTEHWQKVRAQALARAHYRCQVCNSPHRVQVHHRTYERRGEEQPEDLTVLCEDCHRLFHQHGRLSRE